MKFLGGGFNRILSIYECSLRKTVIKEPNLKSKLQKIIFLFFVGDILTGTCFVSVLDKTGSLLVIVPLGIYLVIGFGFLASGFILVLPIRKFFKEVMKTDTKEMEKLAGKIGEEQIQVQCKMM